VLLVTGLEGYENNPDAPYCRSQRRDLTPAQTSAATQTTLVRVVVDIDQAAPHHPITIDLDRIVC